MPIRTLRLAAFWVFVITGSALLALSLRLYEYVSRTKPNAKIAIVIAALVLLVALFAWASARFRLLEVFIAIVLIAFLVQFPTKGLHDANLFSAEGIWLRLVSFVLVSLALSCLLLLAAAGRYAARRLRITSGGAR